MTNANLIMGVGFFVVFIFIMTAGVNNSLVKIGSITNPMCSAGSSYIDKMGVQPTLVQPVTSSTISECAVLYPVSGTSGTSQTPTQTTPFSASEIGLGVSPNTQILVQPAGAASAASVFNIPNYVFCVIGSSLSMVVNFIIAVFNALLLAGNYLFSFIGLLFSPCSIFSDNPSLYALVFIPIFLGVIYIVAQAIKPSGGG